MVAKAKTTTKTAKKPTKTAQPKTTAAKKATPSKKSKQQMITDDDIARQAYMLWLERGGSEMENWLEAERQLR